jgi:Universal stress protein UspA and related nucleotide-binding proteins
MCIVYHEEGTADMLKHILVTLDGSPSSEESIPVAARIARNTGATITIVRVYRAAYEFTAYSMEAVNILDSAYTQEIEETQAYLSQIAHSENLRDLKVQTAVIAGNPQQVITEFVKLEKADLVVMCTRDNKGLKRWVAGSVTQYIMRHTNVPILILHRNHVPAVMTAPNPRHRYSMLVALDGSQLAEAALQPAAQISAALSSPFPGKLHLIRVVPTSNPDTAATTTAQSELNSQRVTEAQNYLTQVEERIRQGLFNNVQVEVNSSVVLQGDIASTLIKATGQGESGSATAHQAIAIATHDRHGFSRLLESSVTDHILENSQMPLLVVHLADKQETTGQLQQAKQVSGINVEEITQ